MRTVNNLNVAQTTGRALRAVLIVGAFGLLLQSAHAQDPSGTVAGVVRSASGEALPGVNVRLEGTGRGGSSDAQGRYEITRVPVGTHTLVASYVGFETRRREVQVTAGEVLRVAPLTLRATRQRLEDVVVESIQDRSFTEEASAYVAKLPIRDIDNPQVYHTITAGLLDDQVVTNFEEALTNAPGLFKLWESTGRGGDGAGYYALRGFSVQPTMVNGLPALTHGTPDPANIERIEVIKGPSGTLYGSSLISYGGLINVVTKRPYDTFGGEVAYRTGSFGLNRIVADANTPVAGADGLAVRFVGAFDDRNSFQDAGFSRSVFVAPSLAYEVNERLSFLVRSEYYTSERTNPTMLFLSRSTPTQASTPEELGYDVERSYTDNDLTIRNPTFGLQAEMRYALSRRWTSQTVLSRSSARADGYYTYLYDLTPDGSATFSRFVSDQNATTLGTDVQQNFIGDFAVGGVRNRLVVGLDYFHERLVNNSTGYVPFGEVTVPGADDTNLSRAAADAALAEAEATRSTTEQATYSAYALDVVELLPQLSVLASLRLDHFDQEGDTFSEEDDYTQTALSPKFGVVVQPVPDRLSLFANYMNGFSNVAPRVQDDGSTETFSPERANQWEVGAKTSFLGDRLTATLSYYDITVSDVVREDPERVNFFVQDGENYSRGFEASLAAAPVAGLALIAGYSYNESEIQAGAPEYRGRRPEQAGPQHLVNGWISYRVPGGVLEGLGLGLGGNYASENVTLNRTSTGRFTLPSYTTLDAVVSYATSTYRLALKVDNLTDEEYYKGWSTVNPQAPRSATASFSYRF